MAWHSYIKEQLVQQLCLLFILCNFKNKNYFVVVLFTFLHGCCYRYLLMYLL